MQRLEKFEEMFLGCGFVSKKSKGKSGFHADLRLVRSPAKDFPHRHRAGNNAIAKQKLSRNFRSKSICKCGERNFNKGEKIWVALMVMS